MSKQVGEQVIPVMIRLQCDCGEFMVLTDHAVTEAKQPVFMYKCECGESEVADRQYPYIEYHKVPVPQVLDPSLDAGQDESPEAAERPETTKPVYEH